MKNLLFAVLVADVACWSTTSSPRPSEAPAAIEAVPKRGPQRCTEGGERLHVVTCREGDALVWTVTNQTDVPIWAFVAPPAGRLGAFSRENAAVRAENGHLVLAKIVFPSIEGERQFTGAVSLAPGATDHGVVPVGERLDPYAPNFTGASVSGTSWVMSVELDVGFAEQRPVDGAQPVPKLDSIVVLTRFDRKRQEIASAPAVPWR